MTNHQPAYRRRGHEAEIGKVISFRRRLFRTDWPTRTNRHQQSSPIKISLAALCKTGKAMKLFDLSPTRDPLLVFVHSSSIRRVVYSCSTQKSTNNDGVPPLITAPSLPSFILKPVERRGISFKYIFFFLANNQRHKPSRMMTCPAFFALASLPASSLFLSGTSIVPEDKGAEYGHLWLKELLPATLIITTP